MAEEQLLEIAQLGPKAVADVSAALADPRLRSEDSIELLGLPQAPVISERDQELVRMASEGQRSLRLRAGSGSRLSVCARSWTATAGDGRPQPSQRRYASIHCAPSGAGAGSGRSRIAIGCFTRSRRQIAMIWSLTVRSTRVTVTVIVSTVVSERKGEVLGEHRE